MSTTVATPTAHAAPRSGTRLRGLTWVVWRQNRTAVLFLLGLALAAAVTLLVLGQLHLAAARELYRCQHGTGSSCTGLGPSIDLESRAVHGLLTLLVPAPVVVGALLGAGSVAADIESGRVRLLFTQSVSPAQWLRRRVAVPLGTVLLVAAVTGAAATWVDNHWTPDRKWLFQTPDWFAAVDFWSTLPALFAVSAFAFAAGVLCALTLRRVLPALAVTTALTGLAVGAVHALRAQLWPAVVVNHKLDFTTARSAWIVDGGVVDHGVRLPITACGDPVHRAACEAGTTWTAYHPLSHHWPVQFVASAVLLVPTVLLLCLAFPALRRLAPSGRGR